MCVFTAKIIHSALGTLRSKVNSETPSLDSWGSLCSNTVHRKYVDVDIALVCQIIVKRLFRRFLLEKEKSHIIVGKQHENLITSPSSS